MKRERKWLQRTAAVALAMALLGSGLPVQAPAATAQGKEAQKTYIITAEGREEFEELTEEYDSVTDGQSEEVLEETETFTAELTGQEVKELRQDDRVDLIEEDICVQGSGKKTPQKKAGRSGTKGTEEPEWNMDIVNLADSRQKKPEKQTAEKKVQGKKIRVALVDSGIDDSEDIDVKERKNFVPGQEGISPVYEDCTGHGTAVAGIIAAKDNKIGITGVNSDVELYSARVLDENNQARVSQIIAAIDWAVEKKVDILNLSLGTAKDSEALHRAIRRAAWHDILVIAAAGNGKTVEYPAAYEETVAVGSVGTDGRVSENSARGSSLELVAPGEQILSTGMLGGLMTCGGTSLAAPHVTGVASLLWQQDREADAGLIRMALDAGAKKYGGQESYGYGLVDYGYARSIYDACKKAYEEKGKTEPEELWEETETGVNREVPETERYQDVDYVEGRWGGSTHQGFAVKKGSGITGDNLKVLKLGAVANDNYVKHMVDHPEWHGYFITDHGEPINYVTCYIYFTRLAQAFSKGASKAPRPSYMTDIEYNGIKKYIDERGLYNPNHGNKTVKWSTILGKHKVNNKNKMLLVYGMALHVATDTFAHSSYDLNGKHTIHYKNDKSKKDKDADNIYFLPNREKCAREIADKVLGHIYKGESGTISDFRLNSYNTGKDKVKCFKLKRIARYIKAIDSKYYSKNKAYFDKMDVSSLK